MFGRWFATNGDGNVFIKTIKNATEASTSFRFFPTTKTRTCSKINVNVLTVNSPVKLATTAFNIRIVFAINTLSPPKPANRVSINSLSF